MAINAQELQGQWNKLRGQVKEKWGQLTDDDLQIHGGNIDQLVGKIQQKTGEGREAIEKFLTELTSQGRSAISQAAGAVGNFAHRPATASATSTATSTDQAREKFDATQDRRPTEPGAVGGGGLRDRPGGRPDRRPGPPVSLNRSSPAGPTTSR